MALIVRTLLVLTVTLAYVGDELTEVYAQESGRGTATVVHPVDRTIELASGDSNTEFRLRLPDDAACPGDSAHDDFRVNSFLVPAAVDPSQLRFQPIGPVGPNTDSRWALYTTAPGPYSQRLTLANGASGEPGRIEVLPVMTFSFYPLETLPAGRYHIGITCSPGLEQTTSTFWSTEIELEHDPSVQPGGLRWSVVGSTATLDDGAAGRPIGTWVAAGVLVVGAGAFALLRRGGSSGINRRAVTERT